MKTCIITPTWNNEDYTIRCFESIAKSTTDYKIIWVENGSKPESREKVKKFLDENKIPYEPIYNEQNLGFVKATNQGMKRAMELGAKYLVLENNDTEVYDGWLERMTEVAESDPKIGVVGPITSPCDSRQSIINIASKIPELKDLPKYENNPKEYAALIKDKYGGKSADFSPTVAFFSTLIKRETVNEIGYLSEDYGIGFCDDDDYCARARRAGWKIALAIDVFVFHNHRTTFKSAFSEEEIKEMKKVNLTKFGEKFSNDKNYDFERYLSTGKMYKFQGKDANNDRKIKNTLKRAYYVIKKDGILRFIKLGWDFILQKRK